MVHCHPQALVPAEQQERFFEVVRAGFGQKRKQLHNSLTANLGIAKERVDEALVAAGIDRARRAQTLSIDAWRRLALALGD